MDPAKMYIVVTADVEEDNWYSDHRTNYSTENIREMPVLQRLFDDAGIKPTYLINYPVATDSYAIGFFGELMKEGKCEIGTHIHPWNTPPLDEEFNDRNKMLCNLPEDLQYKKLRYLHETIRDNFKFDPISFRAGRWAFDEVVARNIHRLRYKIDTSVTPFTDWSNILGPDYSDIPPDPYRYNIPDRGDDGNGQLLEVPASIGYLQKNQIYWNRIYKMLKNQHFDYFKVLGFLNKVNILNKVWLTPEVFDVKEMIKLVERFRNNGSGIINMTLHSNSMKCGLNPFVKDIKDLEIFKNKLCDFLSYVNEQGIKSVRLSDVPSVKELTFRE